MRESESMNKMARQGIVGPRGYGNPDVCRWALSGVLRNENVFLGWVAGPEAPVTRARPQVGKAQEHVSPQFKCRDSTKSSHQGCCWGFSSWSTVHPPRKKLENFGNNGSYGGVYKLIDNQKSFDTLTRCSLFLAWCLRNEGVSSVLLGSSTPEQLIENLGAIQASSRALSNKLQGNSRSLKMSLGSVLSHGTASQKASNVEYELPAPRWRMEGKKGQRHKRQQICYSAWIQGCPLINRLCSQSSFLRTVCFCGTSFYDPSNVPPCYTWWLGSQAWP